MMDPKETRAGGDSPPQRETNPVNTGSENFAGAACGESAREETPRGAEQLKAKGEAAKSQAQRAAEKARSQGQETMHQAQAQASEAMRQAQSQGQEFAVQQKDRIASEFDVVGDAVHQAAEKLREEHDETAAKYTDFVAGGFHSSADYLRRRDLSHLIDDAECFARERPELFLGGMFVAGLTLSRFLKASGSSGRRRRRSEGDGSSPERRYEPPAVTPTPDDAARPHSLRWQTEPEGAAQPGVGVAPEMEQSTSPGRPR